MIAYEKGDVVLVSFPFSNQTALKKRPAVIWQEAGLLKPSAVKTAISTIEQSLIYKKIGKLSQNDLLSMEATLKEFLDLK